MPRTVILDGNVLDQLNRGNTAAATALKNLLKNGSTVYVSQQAYNEMVKNSAIPRSQAANQLFLDDLGIKVASPGKLADRVSVYSGSAKLSEADLLVVAQAKSAGAELWSFDRVFRKNHAEIAATLQVKIASETINVGILDGKVPPQDYRVARRIMNLAPVDISLTGGVTRPGPKGSPPGVTGPPPGAAPPPPPPAGPAGSGASPSTRPPATAGRGPAPPGIDPGGVNATARSQAIGGGIQLGLRIFGTTLNLISESIEKQRAEEALKGRLPEIEQLRSADPRLGVLVRFVFSQGMAHGDSAINPSPVFEHIELATGFTKDEAVRSFPPSASTLKPKTGYFNKDSWIEPSQQASVAALRLPFPKQARGCFAPNARFVTVEWGGVTGFDDEEEGPLLLLPSSIDFYILKPSSTIVWYNGNFRVETAIPIVHRESANKKTLEAINLDPDLPWNITAAMVFPANDATDEFFSHGKKTLDTLNLLRVLPNFGKVRWIRPENIEVTETF